MERRFAKHTEERKGLPVEWALHNPERLLFVSVPYTNCDENQGSSGSRREPPKLTDCLSGMMESVITDSQCPEADGKQARP